MPKVSPGTSIFPWSDNCAVCVRNACCIVSMTRIGMLGDLTRSTITASVSHNGMAPYSASEIVPEISYVPPCLSFPHSG